jgi:hypothetical protein
MNKFLMPPTIIALGFAKLGDEVTSCASVAAGEV